MHVNLGTIDRQQVEIIKVALGSLGTRGRLTIDPLDGPRVCNLRLDHGVRVIFQAPYTVDYRFTGDVCLLTFADQLRVRWGLVSVAISESVINLNEIVFQAGLLQGRVIIE